MSLLPFRARAYQDTPVRTMPATACQSSTYQSFAWLVWRAPPQLASPKPTGPKQT